MPHPLSPSTDEDGAAENAVTTETKASDSSDEDKSSDALLTLAASAKVHEETAEAKKQGGGKLKPAPGGGAFAPVTPSPYGPALSFRVHAPPPYHGGAPPRPDVSPGARRLFPSPIKVVNGVHHPMSPPRTSPPGRNGEAGKRRREAAGPHPYPVGSPTYPSPYRMYHPGIPPPYPGYHTSVPYPHPEFYSFRVGQDPKSPFRKGPMKQGKVHDFSPMKAKGRSEGDKEQDRRNDVPSERTPASEGVEAVVPNTEKDESSQNPPSKKQRIISPSSSLEVVSHASTKEQEEVSPHHSPMSPHGNNRPPPPPPRAHGPPPQPRLGHPAHFDAWHYMPPPHHPMYPPPGAMHPPPPGYHMYPPPHPHRLGPYPPMGPPPPPGARPSYPRPHLSPPRNNNLSAPSTPSGKGLTPLKVLETPENKDKEEKDAPSSSEDKINSIADWQRAAIATGLAPSAKKCVPLKGPIPSKYWGDVDKAMNTEMPEFHHLVNYPDYMNKCGTSPGSGGDFGKKHCVMCGKERLSSANALTRSRTTAKSRSNVTDQEDDGTVHIIPRQNKGLCTACDVRVWIICDSSLEIKWCKGCKNFRPWAAFGDKGLATKCVRCRDRQREKYALQKDELKQRRRATKEQSTTNNELAAARGLHNLIAATVEITEKV